MGIRHIARFEAASLTYTNQKASESTEYVREYALIVDFTLTQM